jgi:lipopolysaccharide/colanic/teichoic acid biosynthesis glycosyltransferase
MPCNKFWHVQSRVAEAHLNHEELLQESVVNSSAHQEDGQHLKQHINLSFVMSQIIKKALDESLAFLHLSIPVPLLMILKMGV